MRQGSWDAIRTIRVRRASGRSGSAARTTSQARNKARASEGSSNFAANRPHYFFLSLSCGHASLLFFGGMPRPVMTLCPSCGDGFGSASLPIHARVCASKLASTKYECTHCRGFFFLNILQQHVAECGARPLREYAPPPLPPPPSRALRRLAQQHSSSAHARGLPVALPPTSPAPLAPAPAAAFSVEPGGRARCGVCERVFSADRIAAHASACARAHRPRPKYDAAAHRVVAS